MPLIMVSLPVLTIISVTTGNKSGDWHQVKIFGMMIAIKRLRWMIKLKSNRTARPKAGLLRLIDGKTNACYYD